MNKIKWGLFWLAMIPVCLIMCLVDGLCQLTGEGDSYG